MRLKLSVYSFVFGFTNSWTLLQRQFTLRVASFLISLMCIVIWLSGSLRFNVLISRKAPSVQMEPYEIMNTYRESDDTSKYKKILFWNEAYGGKTYDIGIGSDVFHQAGCPVWKHSEKTVTASVICLLAARSTSLAFRKYRSNGGFL